MRLSPRAGAAACVLLALGGCGKSKEQKPPPPAVEVANPARATVRDWQEVVGRFVSIDAVEVRPRVSGYVQKLGFRDGERVTKGQLLFLIDPRPYQATLDRARATVRRAEATLATARVELTRARNLFAANALSQQDLQTRIVQEQQAVADLASARADAAAAALDVSFCSVRAAVSGRVSDRRVSPGNLVTADQTVLTSIVTLDPIRFAFEAPESVYLPYAGTRKMTGAPVEVRLQNEAGFGHRGTVEFVDNQVSPTAGTIRGRAVLPNPDGALTPGLFGQMRLSGARPYQALLVPDAAVSQDQDRQVVNVVDGKGVVREITVKSGPLVGGMRVVREGLKPGMLVVVAGRQKAEAGEKVRLLRTRLRPPAAGFGARPAEAIATPDAAAGIVVGG